MYTMMNTMMGTNNGHSDINPSDGNNGVDDLTNQMAKLWWPDGNQRTTDSRAMPMDISISSFDNDNDNDNAVNILVDKAKCLASMTLKLAMERIWAKELYEMDPSERQDITNEIHGVQSSRAIQETPEVISEGVQSLRDYIHQTMEFDLNTGEDFVPDVTKKAYKRFMASELKEGGNEVPYIDRQKFLLKFLRACRFDIEKAGQRYFRCLQLMHELFGNISFKRPLMMMDLTNREVQYLKKGQMQLLPSRDRAGRRIFAFSGREDRTFTIREKYRTLSYLIDVCSEDETTQKLGLVSLQSPKIDPGDKPFGEKGMALRSERHKMLGGLTEREYYHKFQNAMPLRVSAIHYFGPETFLYKIGTSLILFLLGKEERKILRFHGGSQMECNYSLKSFGINPDDVPVSDDKQIKNKKVAKFIAARKSIESIQLQQYRQRQQAKGITNATTTDPFVSGNITTTLSSSHVGVECPEVNCVTFGNRARYNAANLEFSNILKVMETDRQERIARCETVPAVKEFIKDIIQTAKSPEHNLRFVAYDKTTSLFVEIDDFQELYSAVSQRLRDQRKRTRLQNRLLKTKREQTQQGKRPKTMSVKQSRSLTPTPEEFEQRYLNTYIEANPGGFYTQESTITENTQLDQPTQQDTDTAKPKQLTQQQLETVRLERERQRLDIQDMMKQAATEEIGTLNNAWDQKFRDIHNLYGTKIASFEAHAQQQHQRIQTLEEQLHHTRKRASMGTKVHLLSHNNSIISHQSWDK